MIKTLHRMHPAVTRPLAFGVEAAFGHDSLIQPRFVLPVAVPRLLPVKAFVVGTNAITLAKIEAKVDYANKIFSQAGIRFVLVSVSNNVASASDCVVAEYDDGAVATGGVKKVLSQQARRLMNIYTTGDCIELYFVNQIIKGHAAAFRGRGGIIISDRATDHVLAHEIGHCFGLKDCYANRGTGTACVWIDRHDSPVDEPFMSRPCDWGDEQGRGFYATEDTREAVLYDFLMYGVDGKDGTDIPAADVLSLTKHATQRSQTQRSPVGSDYFKQNNSEVFTR